MFIQPERRELPLAGTHRRVRLAGGLERRSPRRQRAGDASFVMIAEDADGQPLSVGRRTRSIPPVLRRALRSRDRGCRFPGCTQAHHLDGHHIHHWADRGETSLANLVSLCRSHHRQVHEARVVIERLDDGGLRFRRPGGTSFVVVTGGWEEDSPLRGQSSCPIDAQTAATRWRGERMDCALAVDVLLRQAGRRPNVSAETELRGLGGGRTE